MAWIGTWWKEPMEATIMRELISIVSSSSIGIARYLVPSDAVLPNVSTSREGHLQLAEFKQDHQGRTSTPQPGHGTAIDAHQGTARGAGGSSILSTPSYYRDPNTIYSTSGDRSYNQRSVAFGICSCLSRYDNKSVTLWSTYAAAYQPCRPRTRSSKSVEAKSDAATPLPQFASATLSEDPNFTIFEPNKNLDEATTSSISPSFVSRERLGPVTTSDTPQLLSLVDGTGRTMAVPQGGTWLESESVASTGDQTHQHLDDEPNARADALTMTTSDEAPSLASLFAKLRSGKSTDTIVFCPDTKLLHLDSGMDLVDADLVETEKSPPDHNAATFMGKTAPSPNSSPSLRTYGTLPDSEEEEEEVTPGEFGPPLPSMVDSPCPFTSLDGNEGDKGVNDAPQSYGSSPVVQGLDHTSWSRFFAHPALVILGSSQHVTFLHSTSAHAQTTPSHFLPRPHPCGGSYNYLFPSYHYSSRAPGSVSLPLPQPIPPTPALPAPTPTLTVPTPSCDFDPTPTVVVAIARAWIGGSAGAVGTRNESWKEIWSGTPLVVPRQLRHHPYISTYEVEQDVLGWPTKGRDRTFGGAAGAGGVGQMWTGERLTAVWIFSANVLISARRVTQRRYEETVFGLRLVPLLWPKSRRMCLSLLTDETLSKVAPSPVGESGACN
ncbi:hypothetical protein M427DRAFT_29059 [Gonapodya prolifera JEL478]|uniref:Uncharacterized protein n=1 Tax=Gonapodya prolifera (strain JEL478) TaxID=1344416 RepID=A0A139ASB3_GONPJ|nr:hypothetical protein M427DRAFT_29059 [Gonapodya prolifera JEL478]|eukprot:KXS19646.1 hypothetical protein M427DRAFT_29059 [Gonapodya prolifera JEL478]